MCILLFTMLVLTLVGCLTRKENYLNEYEITKYKFIEKQSDFQLPELDIDEVESEDLDLIYLGEFWLTGYCDCEICQGPWSGTTALGIPPTVNNTVAIDPDVIPLGSYIIIDGVTYHCEDTGSAINGNDIDVFVGSHEECYSEFCNGWHEVYLINS